MMSNLAYEFQKRMPPPPFDAPEGLHWQVDVSMYKTDYTVNFQAKWRLHATIQFDESFAGKLK